MMILGWNGLFTIDLCSLTSLEDKVRAAMAGCWLSDVSGRKTTAAGAESA